MIIGWIGLGILMSSYLLLITKWYKWFLPVDVVASIILTIYAIMIKDVPFIIVNGFIAIMLFIKVLKGGLK
ncbi:hypothetical protein KAI04_03990 [Candidatus Pacearchaeota archaeon]|nr:hypothetical protein [Candidatus Pacearchaeota archaeon]